MARWQPVHHWAAMALQAADTLPEHGGTLTLAVVLPDSAVRGGPDRATRTVRRQLSAMTPPGTGVWDHVTLVHVDALPPASTSDRPRPAVLAVTGTHNPIPALVLAGTKLTAPVMGVVAVQRGYVQTMGVVVDGNEAPGHVWVPAGPGFPNENPDGQAAVAAFAVDRVSGDTAVLGHRVHTLTQPLTPEETAQVVDLEPGPTGLGVGALLDLPTFALRAACGRPMDIPDVLRVHLPQPGWVVGRWWLHTLWRLLLTAVEETSGPQAAEAAEAGDITDLDRAALAGPFGAAVDLTAAPPRELASSWASVAADQVHTRRLGVLVDGAMAQLLPADLFAEVCISGSPSQSWLWQQIGALLDDPATADVLERVRASWQRWPELHEPDHFVGRPLSLRP